MSAVSLKPCPFCGGETVDLSYADGLWRAECDVCVQLEIAVLVM